MKTIRTVKKLRAELANLRARGGRIALVPTMGNLHAGHLALVAEARALADHVVASIFVNPTQFGPGEDFASYPRTLERDRRQLAAAGADLLFAPPVDEIYPDGATDGTVVCVPGLSTILCGASRPGHFAGVASVVTRLFNIVQPDVAAFGEKDYQQLLVIRRLQADLHLPIRIVGVPTQRNVDGLALSSRNQYLSAAELQRAPELHRALVDCAGQLQRRTRSLAALEKQGLARLTAAGFRPDYFVIRNAADLTRPGKGSRELVVLAAARLGRTRLIDNVQARV